MINIQLVLNPKDAECAIEGDRAQFVLTCKTQVSSVNRAVQFKLKINAAAE